MTKYVRVKKFSELSGYSEQAVHNKMYEGVWREGEVFKRAPDGNPLISIEGYERWVEAGQEQVLSLSRRRSASASRGREGATAKR